MVIEPREKSWGPDYLKFGLGFASDFEGDNLFNLLFQYRRTWLNRLGGEWLTEAQIGQDTHLFSEFYQPLDEAGRWFVAPLFKIGRQMRGVFVGDDKVADYLADMQQIGIAGGAVLGTWGQLRIGPLWSHVDAHVDTGSPVLPAVEENTSGLQAALFIDQTDHAWFPTRGVVAGASAYAAMESFGADASYQRLEGFVRGATSWGQHVLQLTVSGGTDLESDMPAYESFTLGGPLRLSGYRVDQFAGREFSFGRLMYYNKTIPLPDILGSGIYVGGSAEVGRVAERFDDLPSSGTLWSGSLFLGVDASVGPLYLGVGLGESGNWSLYLLLGAP